MSQIAPAQYLISLCALAQECQESFGIAMRIGASNSKFNIETTKVIHSILTFSPAPDAVAVEFLNELEKVKGIAYLARNPGGKKTPQDTAHPTPDIYHLREIPKLLEESITKRSQSALKQLLFWRDGFFCPFTGLPFKPPGRHVIPRASHILPFSFRDKHLTLSALETFTGRTLADEVVKMINHPSNAFNAESNAHDSHDKLAWGIEALRADDQWKYYFREIRLEEISPTITLSDGQEIVFRRGDSNGQVIDKPNPEYCNMKLAIARAMHACGAADIIAEMDWDNDGDETIVNQPVYLGGPSVPDDALFRRLEDRLLD